MPDPDATGVHQVIAAEQTYLHYFASRRGASPLGRAMLVRLGLATCLGLATSAAGASQSDNLDVLKTLSLEDLINVEVTIASKTPKKLSEVAAAVFVITPEDIRRSGATSLPQVLRMVPGMHVGRIDNRNWAVGIRGFNGRFSNKLLVQMDGRSLYTPQFSGVYWDAQDFVLADIEKIEVIRGPGATLWGANAVNGIINIITRSAHDTADSFVSATAGEHNLEGVTLRHGGRFGTSGAYRAYIKRVNQDSPFENHVDGVDSDYLRRQAGFRMDWGDHTRESFTLQGDIYDNRIDQQATSFSLSPPYIATAPGTSPFDGANLLWRWNSSLESGRQNTLQVYFDRNQRTEVSFSDLDGDLAGTRETIVDFDWQQSVPFEAHRLVWGLGYRRSKTSAGVAPSGERSDHLFSAFVQDEFPLTDRLTATVGTKLEHNQYSGFEVQPSIRALWKLNEVSSLWGAVSRAVRTPARLEHDVSFIASLLPPSSELNPLPFPVLLPFEGDSSYDSEEALTAEFGFRTLMSETISLDVAAFATEYDQLGSIEIQEPELFLSPPDPYVVVPTVPDNRLSAFTYGIETAVDWRPSDRWQIRAAYSWLSVDVEFNPDSADVNQEAAEGQAPEHQLSIRSSVDFGRGVSLDLWLRYVDELTNITPNLVGETTSIDSYTAMDVRLAWRRSSNLELSLVGQDLLGAHSEFESEFVGGPQLKLGASYYARLEWRF